MKQINVLEATSIRTRTTVGVLSLERYNCFSGSVMKRGLVLVVVGIALLIVSFLPLHWVLPDWIVSSGSYDLEPGGIGGPSLNLFFGSHLKMDTVISGANNDVYFYITDSSGVRIFDAGRIYDGYHLDLDLVGLGSFSLNFDNTMSWFSHKFVIWSIGISYYEGLFLALGVLLLLPGVVQIWREEKVTDRIKKLLFKQPEGPHWKCEYCGSLYDKTLLHCPKCDGPRKAGVRSKN